MTRCPDCGQVECDKDSCPGWKVDFVEPPASDAMNYAWAKLLNSQRREMLVVSLPGNPITYEQLLADIAAQPPRIRSFNAEYQQDNSWRPEAIIIDDTE